MITVQQDRLLLPVRMHRPGVGRTTLDLAGGRLEDRSLLTATTRDIVRREFGIEEAEPIASAELLNTVGWDVDSSSSSQRLYGIVASLHPRVAVPGEHLGVSYPATRIGGQDLLADLACVQCRAVVCEWLTRLR